MMKLFFRDERQTGFGLCYQVVCYGWQTLSLQWLFKFFRLNVFLLLAVSLWLLAHPGQPYERDTQNSGQTLTQPQVAAGVYHSVLALHPRSVR